MIRAGFIGLGSQGGPMARRIVEAGYPLTIWARRRETLEPFSDTAAVEATTPAALGAASDVVSICVVADKDVEEVLLRPDGVLAGLPPGGIVAIHSTIHPETCRRVAALASKQGITVIDAPVSGGGVAASARKLLVMAGGDEEALTRCRPVLETFAEPILHLGGLGSGLLAKLINNLVFTAHIATALETFEFGDGFGLDRAALAEVLAHGTGGSRAAAVLAGSGFDLTGLRRVARPLLRKDVDIALKLARAHRVRKPTALADLASAAISRLDSP